MTAPTALVGLSHLGLVAAAGWASVGRSVVAIDPDPALVGDLRAGRLPVHEPGLEDLLARHREAICFTTEFESLSQCPLVILARDVPTDSDNASDLTVIAALVDRVVPHLKSGATLVVMNQVPPGFTRALADRLGRERPGDAFDVYYWVETLVLGRALERFLRPERIIIGAADPAQPLPQELAGCLASFLCPILPMRYESAELTKAAINLYLASSVTYANTLSDLCEKIGADWSEMVPALRLDARIGPAAYLRAGLGVTGGNLERDLVSLRALVRAHDVDGVLIDTVITYNERRHRWARETLEGCVFAANPKPTIALWGLAYKKDTRSTKNAASLRVIDDLRGRAILRAYDPLVRTLESEPGVAILGSPLEAATGADCVLIVTDWDEFSRTDVAAVRRVLRRPVIIDCVGVLEGRRQELSGIVYVSMGRGAAA